MTTDCAVKSEPKRRRPAPAAQPGDGRRLQRCSATILVASSAQVPWLYQPDMSWAVCRRPAATPSSRERFMGSILTKSDRSSAAYLAASRTLVAVERYRVLHGRWPDSLEDPVPGLMRSVPPDPFDGRPLRYRRLSDGIVVYSVGSNLADDGGNLTPATPPAEPLDFGFRLYDVSKRYKLRKKTSL